MDARFLRCGPHPFSALDVMPNGTIRERPRPCRSPTMNVMLAAVRHDGACPNASVKTDVV